MITFKELTIEGFASIVKPLSYNLASTGVNLIVGNNGSGKSTIFNALCWAIYGKLLKVGSEMETWDALKKLSSYQGTMVTVTMRIGLEEIKIIRCKDYKSKLEGKKGGSGLFLYINGELYTKHKNKLDITQKIQSIMGMSFELFKNSLAFGQNLTRLLRETGSKQKELFDEAFNIIYINKARESAKARWDELKEVLNSHQHAIEILDIKISSLQQQIDNDLNLKKTFEKEKVKKIKDLKNKAVKIQDELQTIKEEKLQSERMADEISKVEAGLKKIEETLQKYNTLSNDHFRKDLELTQKDGELVDVKNRMNEIIKHLSNPIPKCHVCGNPITRLKHDERKAKLKIELGELRTSRVSLLNQYSLLKLAIDKLSSELESQEKIRKQIIPNKRVLESKKEELKKLAFYPEKLKSKKLELNSIINQIRDTRNNSLKLNTDAKVLKRAKLEQERAVELEIKAKIEKYAKLHDWLVTDALSNKGLKAYVFYSMLSQINRRLKYYAKTGWRIEFIMDLDSGYKNFKAVIFDQNDVRPYEDLSGGEQQIVDICLAFSMHDVLAEEKFNILLMDEVFESLDKGNIELVTDLIHRKAQKVSIHLVTHRREFVTSSVKAVYLTKTRSGGTSIVR